MKAQTTTSLIILGERLRDNAGFLIGWISGKFISD